MYIFESVSLPEEIAEQQKQNKTEQRRSGILSLLLCFCWCWISEHVISAQSWMTGRELLPSLIVVLCYFLLLFHVSFPFFSFFILCHLLVFHRFNTPHTDKIELDFLGYRLQLAQVVIFLFFLQFLFCYCVSRFWSYR